MDLTKVLDVCEERISSECNFTMDIDMQENFTKCDNMWYELKNMSARCEDFSTTDCNCWKDMNEMKKNFTAQCISKTLNNATGEIGCCNS